jgi:hypothetical protein
MDFVTSVPPLGLLFLERGYLCRDFLHEGPDAKLGVGINEKTDCAFVVAAHAHQVSMRSVEFCRLTKMVRMSGHYYCQLVTDYYFNH